MASRRRQVVEKALPSCEEDRKEPGSSKKESSRSKKLSRGRKGSLSSPASRREKEEENCSSKKTPQLLSKVKSWDINSPSRDAEQHQEIFWDPHSPTCFKLDNGRKKASSKCTVEISDIVNRIAPKDVTPTNSDASYFGVWIGDDAIPCTPVVTRTRSKLPRTRILKTEEKLMELAKQLDRNLVEHKDQNNDESIEKAHKAVADESDASFLEYIPEEEEVSLALKSVSQSSVVGVEKRSQKSVDQEAEEALNALFDCSTQKYSGRLSQALSSVSTSSIQELDSDTVNNTGKTQLLTKDKVQPESNKSSGFFSSISEVQSDVLQSEKNCNQPVFTEKEPGQCSSTTHQELNSQDDFGDDWGDDLLEEDSFVMQITQNPELIATPKSNFTLKDANLDTVKGKGSAGCSANANTSNKLKNFKFVPRKVNESEGSKMKTPDSSNVKGPEESTRVRTISSAHPGVQVTRQSTTDVKSLTSSSDLEVSKTYTFSSKPLNSRKETDVLTKKGTQAAQQSNAVSKNKEPAYSDEWDDPKFSDAVLDMFCESDSLWDDKDNDDDDLLYQVCDDVERLTQVQASEGNTQFASSNHNVFTKNATHNKTETHITTNCSFASNKSSSYALSSNKIVGKGASPVSVSGNCSISFQKSSFQRTTQTNTTFNKTNSMPSQFKKFQEPHSQSVSHPHAATSNARTSSAPSKYTFTRTKPFPAQSVHTDSILSGNKITSKGPQGYVDKRNSCLQPHILPSQESALKRHLSESTIQSSKVFVSEDRSKKCSMEEIERKKQEALSRKKMRERVCSSDNVPT